MFRTMESTFPERITPTDMRDDISDPKVYDKADEPLHVIRGLWVPARDGLLVTIQQWRALDGNFKFFCGGRCMLGPGNPYWWIILIVHLVASVTCCIIFDILEVYSTLYIKVALVILAVLTSLLTIVSIFCVVCTDPGYVLRPDVEQRVTNLIEYLAEKSPSSEVTLQVVVDGKEANLQFCEVCCHYRYPLVEHCSKCDCCIERLDHHNGTFGICIGKRNIGAFIWFLFLSLVNFQVIQTVSCVNIISRVKVNGWSLSAFTASPTLYVLLLSSLHPPFGPLKFSWILLKQLRNLMFNQTTLDLRKSDSMNDSINEPAKPRDCSKNLDVFGRNFKAFVLCPKIASQLKPRSIIQIRAARKDTKRLKKHGPNRIYPIRQFENASEGQLTSLFLPTEGRKSRLRHTLLRRSRVQLSSLTVTNVSDDATLQYDSALCQQPAAVAGIHVWRTLSSRPLNIRRLRRYHTKNRNS